MVTRFLKTAAVAVAAATALTLGACSADGGTPNPASSESDGGDQQASGLTVGWSTIYLSPSWMQQTDKMLNDAIDKYKDEGVVSSYKVLNANGDTSAQVAQIRTMIQQNYDVILVDAGSSTALNPVLEQAVAQGITVVNFDSLVTSEKVIRVGTDQEKWGSMLADWLVDELGGEGDVIVFNGPAGVAVSEDRWSGAEEVFDENPDINVVTTLNSEYNIAPAAQDFAAAYAAHPDVDGVLSLGGALSSAALKALIKDDADLIPITGENYNGFLKDWNANLDNGFSSMSTAQPNYMGVVALHAGIESLNGEDISDWVEIPLPQITNDNLDEYVEEDKPDDYYAIGDLSESEINEILGID